MLDNFAGTYRDGNIRTYAFVDGYAWRYPWSSLESATVPGSYDFTALDHILAQLAPTALKLSMILVPGEPNYITKTVGVGTWMHGATEKPLPWDAYTQARFAAFIQALALHQAPDPAAGGSPVAMKDHSRFYMLNVCLPGMPNGGIRDRDVTMVDIPGYTRTELVDNGIVAGMTAARDAFPNTHLSVGFWSAIEDDGGSPLLWVAIKNALLAQFSGSPRRQVGIFMDNLIANRPCPGCDPYTGGPDTAYAQALDTMQTTNFTAIQALTSWKNPSTQPVGGGLTQADKVKDGTPMDGLDFGFNTYDIRYFELYVEDVDEAAWQTDLGTWADTLRNAP